MVWRDAQDVDTYWLNAVLHEEGAWTAGTFGDVTIERIGADFGLAGLMGNRRRQRSHKT